MVQDTWIKVYNFNNKMPKQLHLIIHDKTGNSELMIISKSINGRFTEHAISIDKNELLKMAESIIRFYKGDV